jgi:sporulation protein YlmC with PRC-barrel domain
MRIMIGASAIALLAISPAISQQDDGNGATWVDIATWDSAFIYEAGWSAVELLDEEAYGSTGDMVGEVEDLIIGPDGNIVSVIVEGGGFLDIGDAHLAVPWDDVTREGTNAVNTPLTTENLDDYGMFEEMDDQEPVPANFRLSRMLGSYVRSDGVGYGDIRDVIFNQEDQIEAVIVWPAYGYGYGDRPIAVPYAGQGYDPYSPYYDLPYTAEQLSELRPFEFGRVQ